MTQSPYTDGIKEELCNQIAQKIILDAEDKYSAYNCKRRSDLIDVNSHRRGPLPIEDCLLTKTTQSCTYGTLDSDCDELDFEDIREENQKNTLFNRIRLTVNENGDSLASCHSLIMYFSKLANVKDKEELVDLNFVESLFENGADINFPDKHGQTVLHEIARGWHCDVATFALENNADVNKADSYGRTALHLASAVDYADMIQYLVDKGADLHQRTYEENQTPMHYAAKNNASHSLKALLGMGSRINDRDYKRRTPLFVAAEAGREEAARFLIEQGAPCGVYDSSGTPLLSVMVEKMPSIALEAIEQFHIVDTVFRKKYFYLGYLELDPKFLPIKSSSDQMVEGNYQEQIAGEQPSVSKSNVTHAKTPLEVIVQYNQLDLIMHPVFQHLLFVKWQLFGRNESLKLLTLNVFYTLIWTFLGLLIPSEGENMYTPLRKNWWRIVLETMGLALTAYFIVSEVRHMKSIEISHNSWKHWKCKQLEEDLKFCHPRWPEEEKYVIAEREQIMAFQKSYFRNPWIVFEWVTYAVILALVITRIISETSEHTACHYIHSRTYAIGLIIIWLRLIRSCRAFCMLGPLIALLGSVVVDTVKFAFLFFEFYIPYTVAFWILFGGGNTGNKTDWLSLNDVAYSVWNIYLLANTDFGALKAVDCFMAEMLCGSFCAVGGIVCMNIYIAMLSYSFSRVYHEAQANAVMEQAKTILLIESKMDGDRRSGHYQYLHDHCSPQEVYLQNEYDSTIEKKGQRSKLESIVRQATNRLNELDEFWWKIEMQRRNNFAPLSTEKRDALKVFILQQNDFNRNIKEELAFLKMMTDEIKATILANIFSQVGDLESSEPGENTDREIENAELVAAGANSVVSQGESRGRKSYRPKLLDRLEEEEMAGYSTVSTPLSSSSPKMFAEKDNLEGVRKMAYHTVENSLASKSSNGLIPKSSNQQTLAAENHLLLSNCVIQENKKRRNSYEFGMEMSVLGDER